MDIDIGKTTRKEEEFKQQQQIAEKEALENFHVEPPKDGKNTLILLAVLAGIFIISFSAFTAYNKFTGGVVSIDELHRQNLIGELNGDGYVYNGYSFIKADGLWWTEINKFETLLKVPLHFAPRDLEEIPVTGELDPRFNLGEEVYIAIDPLVTNKYYTLAISELSFNVVKGLDRTPIGSCTEEHWACENRTIVSCDNTQGLPVVELSLEDGPAIEMSGTCLKVKGLNEYDIVKATNRLLYQWYGIMS